MENQFYYCSAKKISMLDDEIKNTMAVFHECSEDLMVCVDDDGQALINEVSKLLQK